MINIKTYPLVRGLLSYIIPRKFFTRPGSGGSFSSEYCYSVWLRHLNYLIENKIITSISDIGRVAEIGPGDSLGIGLSAIYSGVDEYCALDVIKHSNTPVNIAISEELKEFFKKKRDIPNKGKFKSVGPSLSDYSFPTEILNKTDEYYDQRSLEIYGALQDTKADVKIEYIVPWTDKSAVQADSLDLIFSQAVMEHVADIEFAYKTMYRWLKPGGAISHQIDFKTHEMTKEWNGHWFINNTFWEILSHGRKYPMNRLPLSSHLEMMKEAGFKIRFILPVHMPTTHRNHLPKIPNISFKEEDFITSGALIQAVK